MKTIYGVMGLDGFSREVMPLLEWQVLQLHNQPMPLYFLDDDHVSENVNGVPVVDMKTFQSLPAQDRRVVVAVVDGMSRKSLTEKCEQAGLRPFGVRAQTVEVLSEVEISEGEVLCPFVTLTCNIRIGKSFHANLYSQVAHDCVIGEYVTFASGVRCNGHVRIGDGAFIGSGAVLGPGRPGNPLVIGDGAVVSAGAVVTDHVPAGATVFRQS